ncbi:cytochrome c oxidase subunit 4 [Yinghuangia seranimata]|uniref:cytochrome c oxidase subunit 4 n=1 Tax=Yinghuangia seranimata TaxID=408067 RepID=UPI00248C2E16|nr:cytochrome c oxidase subunit 4 [Yinghuangia seranimata]MDI2126097.1 cytochrome c oxidase subunit 4 [Yinghuangia seranimata]
MKFTGALMTLVAIFLLPVTIIYWVLSEDPTGTTALALAFGLSIMIGYYLWFTARRSDLMPSDNEEGDIADDAGELGFFSPHSWSPLMLACGGGLMFLGIIFGWWLCYFAAPLVVVALFFWVFEYYRGENQNQ